ncbi:TFIIB-type zinc ribbon-containing protein [Anaerolentibacter hominis]|uniref:TFIIB-type zinc ribbon-containing protein n=1 Tax=Anaerolentibacter hominis TaxID=3079009 RepID=UPI0031B80447
MVLQYKCPNCGADMVFDSESGMLVCDSCGAKQPADQYKDPSGERDQPASTLQDTREYQCNNCGAVLITDKDTTATTCSFCGAPMILNDRLSGSLAPAKIIPFSISKEEAQAAFKKWCKNGLLTPKDFMTADRIKNITGIYVPFWLYDVHTDAVLEATCTRVRSYSRGDYIYTETSYFDVFRQADLKYLKVPADASEKMNDELMDKLEPYRYDNLKDFNTPYLAGFIAEKYNYTDQDLLGRMKERVRQYAGSYLNGTIAGYSTTSVRREDVRFTEQDAYYTLLPVWMVCYDYKQSEHVFAMNGQTGKIVGKPPLSKKRMAGWFAGIAGGTFLLIKLIAFLIGGVFF